MIKGTSLPPRGPDSWSWSWGIPRLRPRAVASRRRYRAGYADGAVHGMLRTW